MLKRFIIVAFAAVAVSACSASSVRDVRVMAGNEDEVTTAVLASDLSTSEKDAYVHALARVRTTRESIAGLSVNEIVRVERVLEAKEQVIRDSTQANLQTQDVKREIQARVTFRGVSRAEMLADQDASSGVWNIRNSVRFTVHFKNVSSERLQAVEGLLEIHDRDGRILLSRLLRADDIAAKKSASTSVTLPINHFADLQRELAEAPLGDLRVRWESQLIILDNGLALDSRVFALPFKQAGL